jgi:photosystem II stability/assembly factor-like uncharacterized protein
VATPAVTVFVDADTMYAASGDSPATIAATHDGGASWTDVNLDIGAINGGPVFSFQTPLLGFATFYDPNTTSPLQVFATTDGGLTWTGPKSGKVPHMAASMDKLYPAIGGYLWQSGGKFDNKPYDNRFFLSADGGATWKQYTFPIGAFAPKNTLKNISAIRRDSDGRILLGIQAETGASIYDSSDDGRSWHLLKGWTIDYDTQFLSATDWIAFHRGSGDLPTWSTTNGGESWLPTSQTILCCADSRRFVTPEIGWAIESCRSIGPKDVFCDHTFEQTALVMTTDGGANWTQLGR